MNAMIIPMQPELHATYYHDNFTHLLEHVAKLYWDLLTAEEQQFIEDFRALEANAQQLYIRLLGRRGDLFRIEKLNYAEIHDIPDAISQLEDYSFVVRNEDADELDPYDLINLFNKQELLAWIQLQADQGSLISPLKKSIKRDELDGQILFWLEEEAIDLASLLNNDVLLVYGELEFTPMRLLYFGNLHQDFTDFVLNDLGIYQYESYHIDQTTRLFNRRQQIDDYLSYYDLVNEVIDLRDLDIDELEQYAEAWLDLLQSLPEDKDYADIRQAMRLQTQLNEFARELERREAFSSALNYFSHSPLPPSRERQCRILAKTDQLEAAWQLVVTCYQQPYNEQERQFAITFAKTIIKKLPTDTPTNTPNNVPTDIPNFWLAKAKIEETHISLPMDDVWLERGVEITTALAIEEKESGQCHFVENTLINSVFGLYHWQIVFSDVQGAFVHPYQFRPLDLYEPDFLSRRQSIMDALDFDLVLKPEVFKKTVLNNFAQKQGLANIFVFWEGLNQELIELALDRIPIDHWQLLFQRMWSDIKFNRAGFPDLIHFPMDEGYKLIEVKGPGDTLQKNQKGWLEYFQANQIPYEVAYISLL